MKQWIEVEKFYATGNQKWVNPDHVKRLRIILARLDASRSPVYGFTGITTSSVKRGTL